MLAFLRIKNLAVIADVTLELDAGLTVFTGETGAGKSIILDGLGLALGARASLDQVRAGARRAVVEAAFTAPRDVELVRLLEDAALSGDDGTIVVRRVLTGSASRAYVNDQLVSQQQLKAIGARLVDLHGQHEHQSLLAIGAHRELLDRFAGLEERRDEVAACYHAAVAAGAELEAMTLDERERAQRIDALRFQVDEIDAAALRPGEDEQLELERGRLVHVEELLALAAQATALLYEDDASAATLLVRATRRLERLKELDGGAPDELDAISGARYAAEEAARELQRYLEGLQADPQRLAHVDARLATLHGLRRKYGDELDAIIEHGAAAHEELEALTRHDELLEELGTRFEAALEAFNKAAAGLSEARRRAAGELEKQVLAELAQLGMEGAGFDVAIEARGAETPAGLPAGAGRDGVDRVEFKLAANPGEPAGPLTKVASGGELSRVMLALKLTATDGDPLESMIFDEVDSGIGGGRVAEHLARRLAALAASHQVLVVTHLPQVAAYADAHFAVRKSSDRDGRVVVGTQRLDQAEQVEELARMLGGLDVTEATRRHAREMLSMRR